MTTASTRTIRFFSTIAAVAFSTTAVQAQLTPEHVTRLNAVTSTAISPDGRQIAFTLSQPRAPEEDTIAGQRAYSELWVVPASGGAPRAIVQRPNSAGAPQWTPDGSGISYTSGGQVRLVPAAGGEPRQVTNVATGVIAYQWSPDGQWLAYTTRVAEDEARVTARRRGDDVQVMSERDRPVQLWVMPAAGGDARALTPADQTARDFVWAPDNRRLAVQIAPQSDADADLMYRQIYVVTRDGGTPRLLVPTEGKLGPMAWSPDGSQLAYLGATAMNDPLAQTVYVVRPGEAARALTPPDMEASAMTLAWRDARTIVFVAAEGTLARMYTVPAAGGELRRVASGGTEVFSNVSFARDGSTFALAASTAQHPNEVFTGTLRDGRLRRVTQHNGWLADVALGSQETFEWTARDGWRMEGVLIRPVNAQQGVRAPLAVLPHGGPEGISANGWTTNALYPAQVLAGAGYAVFMPNYRGSGGRGVAFSKGDHRDLGGREFDDVLDGIDALHAAGIADRDRVGISGTSYGGFFSAWAGTKHSERFRLAMPFAGISNWMSFQGTTDIPYEMALTHWDLWPYEHPLLMWERSPMAYINQANTPMIIGAGLVDERVHPEQMIQLAQALRLKDVPVDLVLYPREPHGLLERQHQLDYMRRILDAFNRYVRPATPTT